MPTIPRTVPAVRAELPSASFAELPLFDADAAGRGDLTGLWARTVDGRWVQL